METTATQAAPKLKYKIFSYKTQIAWEEKRRGVLASDGKSGFTVSSPPEFRGEPGFWTPEDLFVAAVDACTMTTFIAFAERLNIGIASYSSRAEGVLEFVDGGYRFTRIILRPVILVDSADAVERAAQALRDAHDGCLIAKSIRAEVLLEPDIGVRTEGPAS
jgi:organic hydroperoxide reductase OsmC/OhrA